MQDKFEKIVTNLLSNALKFTAEGGSVSVNVTIFRDESIDTKSESIRITVQDTGIGIPPKHLEHVFDRFYQIDDSQSRKFEGTGIGLALTKELVELHCGGAGGFQVSLEFCDDIGIFGGDVVLLGDIFTQIE